MLSIGGDVEPVVFAEAEGLDEAEFSPDGQWIAYNARYSGEQNVYVVPYPPTGERVQVSSNGGVQPQWRPDGQELFYRNGDNWMVLSVSIEEDFGYNKPDTLFSGSYINVGGHSYEVLPDAQEFIVLEAVDTTSLFTEIRVIENLLNELNK